MLAFRPWERSRPFYETLPRSVVRRLDVKAKLSAGGLVESAKNTKIKCELENLQSRTQPQAALQGGSSMILFLVPDGSNVKQGDILCRLDSSQYEELVRQQHLTVEQARSSKRMAELNVQVAEVGLREYEDGICKQEEQNFRSQLALAESDVQRARDRLAWTLRMQEKGYASTGQVITDKSTLQRAVLTLSQVRGAFAQFQRFTTRTMIITLQSQVEAARTQLAAETLKFESQNERLEHYIRQVELCTIKAPHDGMVVYANNRDKDVRIEEGLVVRQRQDLFLLPDLSEMAVRTILNETVVQQVHEGMPARVRVEALPDVQFEGHVVFVASLAVSIPASDKNGGAGGDIKNYVAIVKLDSVSPSLRPGMTAQVEIHTGDGLEALVIPPGAVTMERQHEICYVVGRDGLERRQVSVGAVTPDYLEVTEGLAEGEEVVLDPVGNHVTSSSTASHTRSDRYEIPNAD
jgi:HlyD family secretion protein